MASKVTLFKIPRKTTSSVTFRLKIPNFFTLPEYENALLKVSTPSFEFANATWCFRFDGRYPQNQIKTFTMYLARLHFKMPTQIVFQHLVLLDADNKPHCCSIYDDHEYKVYDFEKLEEEERCLYDFYNDESSYYRQDTLTLLIHLFTSTEINVKMSRKMSVVTGIPQHTEVKADQLSVITDRRIASLKQEFKDVLLNGKDYNLTLNIGGKQFRMHQDILRARSEVFRSILNGDMLAKNSGVIHVTDCDPEVFEQLLCYVYTGQVDTMDANNMFSLYCAADKYRLSDLKNECREFIKKSLAVTNVCKALGFAVKHCDASLLDCASKYFIGSMDDVLPTTEWQLFMKENLTAANELFIKSRKKDLPCDTAEYSEDYRIILTNLPSQPIPSISYTLKVPNFFILPYDPALELASPLFKFANATWRFVCDPERIEPNYKCFSIHMERKKSEVPKQIIFFRVVIVDADDEEYIYFRDVMVFKKDEEKHFVIPFSNHDPTYETRDNLTLFIDLFQIEPIEEDADEKTLGTERGFVSLSQDFEDVLFNGQDHNLILNVRGMKFRAHKDILRARSDVFCSMLTHDMLEKNSGVIDIPDCDPRAFEQLLFYIYTERVQKLDDDIMFNLYYAADKYNLIYLKEKCSDFITLSLSVSNVCDALKLAITHCDENILEIATNYFLSKIDEILLTEEWLLFMKDNTAVANELFIKSRLNRAHS